MTIFRPSITFRTRQIINIDVMPAPLVGFESLVEKPEGFLFDIKRWGSPFDLKLPLLPRLADSELQGVSSSEFFKSGVGSKKLGDLEVIREKEEISEYEKKWLPVMNSGHYYIFNNRYYYFSDYSRVQYIDPSENVDNRNVITLEKRPRDGSIIVAASYKRDPLTLRIEQDDVANHVSSFTGSYFLGEERETVTSTGMILWENIDTYKKEFILDGSIYNLFSLRFSRDMTRSHGIIPESLQDLGACINLGISNGTNYQMFFLRHFPIIPESFHLYVATNTAFEEWHRIDNWFTFINSASPNKNSYFLDRDLGIVYFSRGINNNIPPIGHSIVVSYSTTLRVEYEEQQKEDVLTGYDADFCPVSQFLNQGFVCISHQALYPSNITLSINKPVLSNGPKVYGPITIGSDYALLKAKVTSYDGLPIPGTEVSFIMRPMSLGYLNGATSAIAVTNSKGEAVVSYQAPVSASDFGWYVTNAKGQENVRPSTKNGYDGATYTEFIIRDANANLLNQQNEVYMYQILKDDLLLGYDGVDEWIDRNMTPPHWATQSETTLKKWRDAVKLEQGLIDWRDVNYPEGIRPDGSMFGRKVVLWKTGSDAINPVYEGNPPPQSNPITLVPIRPVSIDNITEGGIVCTRLIYPKEQPGIYILEDPNPEDPRTEDPSTGVVTNNVGGYWFVATKSVSFQAFCWSPLENRDIYSNKIVAKVKLPPYLLGEYVNELMKKIPYGWKILSENDNISAGLNGATFICINPHPGPYKIFDLIHPEIDNNEWADAPFKSLSFQVDVPLVP